MCDQWVKSYQREEGHISLIKKRVGGMGVFAGEGVGRVWGDLGVEIGDAGRGV